jgi:hypothetical protein
LYKRLSKAAMRECIRSLAYGVGNLPQEGKMKKNLAKPGVMGIGVLLIALLVMGCSGSTDVKNFNPDVSTGSDFTSVIFLDKPFTDSFTAESKAHAYRIDVPEDIPAVDIYTTGTANRMTIVNNAGLTAISRSSQPARQDVLGLNYNNNSLGLRTTVAVPPERKIFIWIQNVDKLGEYTVITKSCQTVYPSPFEGTWQNSTDSNVGMSIEGNTISFFAYGQLMGQGVFTYTDDNKITITLTHGANVKTNSMAALQPVTSEVAKVDRGLKYQTDCRISGNELSTGQLSFKLADVDPNQDTAVIAPAKWTRK